jgi:hypothetical protein
VTANDPKPDQRGDAPEQTEGDVPNAGPASDPSGRDFGDSAGYGTGGSTRDYREVVGQAQSARRTHPARAGRGSGTIAELKPSRGADAEAPVQGHT